MLHVLLDPSTPTTARGAGRPEDVQASFCATLVDQWVRDGVEHAVVAPGSRSTPMALALAAHRDLSIHVAHDERTAGFVAVGIGMETGRPAVVLCTSGTATTHLHGAVVEAHLSCVPMLVVTANRPPELIDVGAPQAIDQTGLFGTAVRWFHDPGVPSADVARSWRPLARQAFLAAVGEGPGAGPGPVHLALPFREPLVGTAAELPADRLGRWTPSTTSPRLGTLAMEIERERGVIVAGRGVDDPAAVAELWARTGWPILADPRSGCRGLPGAIAAFDAILRHEDLADAHRPDVVVHLGEPIASKVAGQWLAQVDGPQVRVDPTRRTLDPAHTVTHRVVGSIGACCRRWAGELGGDPSGGWLQRWTAFEAAAQAVLDRELDGPDAGSALSEPAVARRLTARDGALVVASSMPVRDVEWFGSPRQRAVVRSNRGANGIDGTIATAIGVAAARREPVTVLLGDLALVHDSSSLAGLPARGLDVRIVVVDNDGGGIFSFLPQATALDTATFERLFGTPHGTDVLALGRAHGLAVADVADRAALDSALSSRGPVLVRVGSDRQRNVDVHRRLNASVVAALDRA